MHTERNPGVLHPCCTPSAALALQPMAATASPSACWAASARRRRPCLAASIGGRCAPPQAASCSSASQVGEGDEEEGGCLCCFTSSSLLAGSAGQASLRRAPPRTSPLPLPLPLPPCSRAHPQRSGDKPDHGCCGGGLQRRRRCGGAGLRALCGCGLERRGVPRPPGHHGAALPDLAGPLAVQASKRWEGEQEPPPTPSTPPPLRA